MSVIEASLESVTRLADSGSGGQETETVKMQLASLMQADNSTLIDKDEPDGSLADPSANDNDDSTSPAAAPSPKGKSR